MPGKTVRVRNAEGREFEAMATDARRHGWEVIDQPQPIHTPAPKAAGKSSKPTPAAVIDSESAPTSEGNNR